jgi:probable addiction module antidote protein
MALKTKPFDVADYLKTDEDIRDFLLAVAEDGDADEFVHALATVARAKGMAETAKAAGLTRSSLYKSLSKSGKPRFETIRRVTEALGYKMTLVAR